MFQGQLDVSHLWEMPCIMCLRATQHDFRLDFKLKEILRVFSKQLAEKSRPTVWIISEYSLPTAQFNPAVVADVDDGGAGRHNIDIIRNFVAPLWAELLIASQTFDVPHDEHRMELMERYFSFVEVI